MANIVSLYTLTDPRYSELKKKIRIRKTKTPLPIDSPEVQVRRDFFDYDDPYEDEPEVFSIVYVIDNETHTKNLVAIYDACDISIYNAPLLDHYNYNSGKYAYYNDLITAKVMLKKLYDFLLSTGCSHLL